jgi:RNA polymerase sigma factor (TIGR02999 family)
MLDGDYLELVRAADAGDKVARERLFALLYDELHRLAERELRRHSSATLSPTTLLHETFLNIRGRESVAVDRKQFMSYAARAMRGLVIDYLRNRRTQKRGGEHVVVTLGEDMPMASGEAEDGEHLRQALAILSEIDARLAECVDLKFFCGLSFRDIAQLWEVSERTVQRDWEKARVMLHRLMADMNVPS